ncbi:helix-turn-helix domain-containing protein [Kutzneria buriramensis]|uniref:ATP-binding protein n=1 Tax=Kutzneria buriramensis TaxID=1045776 RepID=UPI002482E855|nr:helix-turn-helix domain-containing protein [Kutzneria buriramensis]
MLRRLRLRARMTQEELAERSGLSVRTIRGLESGSNRNPKLDSLRLLAEALGLDQTDRDELLGPRPAASAEPAPSRQLPAAPAWFTGRDPELTDLARFMDSEVRIAVISGAGGIGKTSLALRWAHRHLDRFPDGQLFVDLRGFSPDSDPLDPLTAVRGFLHGLGVDPARMTGGLEEHSALYRSHVADKRMLIVLDNAATGEQVVPLLPGTSGCTVLVTSRNILTSLLHRHGAHHLSLGLLTEDETYAMLARRLGAERLAAEPEAVAELAALCGRYPLALAIMSARALARPHIPLAEFAAELHESDLDDDPDNSPSAVMACSVRALTAEQRTTFGLLGVAPGTHIDLPAAAGLTALPVQQARTVLRALEEASLLHRRPGGRYVMHDIVRRYAVDTALQGIAATEREAALRRLLDHYIHTAHAADRLLAPHRSLVPPVSHAPGISPAPPRDHAAALDWFYAEHANLLAAQHAAIALRWSDAIWQLAWQVGTFWLRRGYRHEDLAAWQAAANAVEHLTDPADLARTKRRLGVAYGMMGRHHEAIEHLHEALALAEHHQVVAEQAYAHHQLSWAWGVRGDDQRALEHAVRALDFFRTLDRPVWQATAHAQVGWRLARVGDYDAARQHCQHAVRLDPDSTPDVAADNQRALGYIAHHTGRHRDAIEHYRLALTFARTLSHTAEFAKTLENLGQPHVALGQHDEARAVWLEALELYRQLGRTEDADRARQQLDSLGAARSLVGAQDREQG